MRHEAKWFWGLCIRNLLCKIHSVDWVGIYDHCKEEQRWITWNNVQIQEPKMHWWLYFFSDIFLRFVMFRQYLHYLFDSFRWCADDKQTVRVPLLPLLFPIWTWWQTLHWGRQQCAYLGTHITAQLETMLSKETILQKRAVISNFSGCGNHGVTLVLKVWGDVEIQFPSVS